MDLHEEFRELCAAAIAGELSSREQAKLDAHLAVCPECRLTKSDYEIASLKAVAALAEGQEPKTEESADDSWSADQAEQAFFRRLDREERDKADALPSQEKQITGKRFVYRPSHTGWREIWMTLAAAILLALALGMAAYKTGVKRGTDVARTTQPPRESEPSLEGEVSDAGHQRAQLQAKVVEDAKTIDDLKRQLAEQLKIVDSLRTEAIPLRSAKDGQQSVPTTNAATKAKDEQLSAAQEKLAELQKTIEAAAAQRDENARQAAALEAKVNELTQLVKDREQELDEKGAEVAKGQELLDHDRDIRELMGARDLYMADVHDVSGRGTEKTYGRVFYTKGKRLIFYAFDLDAHPSVQNASSFQAWGRRGPDNQQARSLGIFYEDSASKKRWVLKAADPKSLENIDAVFVTVEPNGGSQHPSGKQLLFAYLRVGANHP
jgi:hypothetical protein